MPTSHQRPLRRPARLFALAVAGLVVVGACVAQSPFLPPSAAAPAAPAPSSGPLDALEFRGVLSVADTTIVTLFNTADGKSLLVEVGQTLNGFRVADYRLEGPDDVVVVESGGRSRTIPMRKATIVALAAPPMPVPPPPGEAGGPPPPPVPGVNAQMSDEEVRQRMQRVAEEIRRRRALRRDMLEGQSPTP